MLAYDGDKVWYWVMTISPSVYKCQLYLLVKPMSSQLEAGRYLTVKLTRAAPSLFIIFMMVLYNKVGMHKQYLRQILHKAFIDNNNNAAFILPFSFFSNSQSPSQNNNTFFFLAVIVSCMCYRIGTCLCRGVCHSYSVFLHISLSLPVSALLTIIIAVKESCLVFSYFLRSIRQLVKELRFIIPQLLFVNFWPLALPVLSHSRSHKIFHGNLHSLIQHTTYSFSWCSCSYSAFRPRGIHNKRSEATRLK